MTIRFEVYGVREAVAELRNYDRAMYQTIIQDLKDDGKPLANKVGAAFPSQPFRRVNNWASTGGRKGKQRIPAYDGSKVRAGVKPAVTMSPARIGKEQGIYRLQQTDGAGAIYDGAGGKTKSQFVKNLDMPYTKKSTGNTTRSRVMYPAMLRNMDMVQAIVDNAISKTNKIVQSHITGIAA
jgi:hypothetical protein